MWLVSFILLQDVILSTFFALGLGAGGVAMAVFATDYVIVNTGTRQIRDALAASAVSQAIYVLVHVLQYYCQVRKKVFIDWSIYSFLLKAFSLLGFLLFGFLAVWVLIYLVKDWNKKVVAYTLKDAVTPWLNLCNLVLPLAVRRHHNCPVVQLLSHSSHSSCGSIHIAIHYLE